MRTILVILLVVLKGQSILAFQNDSLDRYHVVKELITKYRPPIRFKDMNSKYFGFSFIVSVTKDSLYIQYSDNFSEIPIQSVPESFLKKVNKQYKLLKFEDEHPCILIVPVLYKTYTSLDVPIGFERAISNLFPRSEVLGVECLFVSEPIYIVGSYMYTKEDDDFW